MTDDIIIDFSDKETNRQDCVDNLIQNLIEEVGGLEGSELEWDIEDISAVREVLADIIVGKHGIMTEEEFYPYVELEFTELKSELEKEKRPIHVLRGALIKAIVSQIEMLDEDAIALWAGYWLSGECKYIKGWNDEAEYMFTPNALYFGALDHV